MSIIADMPTNKTHHGRNLKRFREMLGINQESLAFELGEDWSQKKISRLEEKEVIEDELLEQIAAILKVPAEAIKNFDEEKAIYNIQNNYDNATHNINYQFNPIEKWVEALDDNKKLYEENRNLYTALLKEKDEKNELLERLLKEKNNTNCNSPLQPESLI
jgi:transcriptional regulator with XRE-family HTH domain